ncbi:MAG: 4a-hydroxytetrahydrobiopterin dehydratase [Deltaproteobacteria bacterium]|nr:4a-hydroxytetrahydrobiopterin dehydratase [Deltaproteobacteria bacterium]
MSDLTQKKCVPCEGGVPPLEKAEVERLLAQIPGWSLTGKWISKEFQFKNFVEAMKLVNQVAGIAEREGHHPDIHIHYNRVRFDIWTHAIGGLSENDFILAAKIDALVRR